MKKIARYRVSVCLIILLLFLLLSSFQHGYDSALVSIVATENGSASAAFFPVSLQYTGDKANAETRIDTDFSDRKMMYIGQYAYGQTLSGFHISKKTGIALENNYSPAVGVQKPQKEMGMPSVSMVTPEMLGAVGDGATDDTAALLAMMDYLKNNESTGFLTKEYLVDSIEMPNNCHLIANGGVLRKIPRNENSYNIIRMNDNCTLEGLTLIGDREYNSSDGQWGCCIFIAGRNCKIIACNAISPHGDGIYVHSDNAVIKGCNIDKAYRNGISVTNGCNFLIEDTVISNVSGHNPQFGIDIEPNNAEDQVEGSIINVSIIDCMGGIMIFKNSEQVKQINVISDGVRIINVKGKAALRIRNDVYTNDKYAFNDLKIINPKPETDCLTEFVFSDKNNPTLFVDATAVGGGNPNAVSLFCKEQSCDNPVLIKIVSEGWSCTGDVKDHGITVDSSNPNIMLSTNFN